ncbi:(d)CMP kinase [Ruminococcaceae bacterium OttesenSCG-928-L11]|nr:(d)CMP kinase [Ruminococcaceae bacterium OttesenSCG-928-L11]
MLNIAIDGPAGAGKSTIAKTVARELGCIYVDTGAMYRAIGLFAVENGIPTKDAAALAPRLTEAKVAIEYREDGQHILLNGRDVSAEIRTPEMGMAASDVSAMPEVRAYLLDLQRDMAATHNVVMDGRDIGTVILPNANVKIFLTASAEERARRRHAEHVAKGENVSYNKILDDIVQRDSQDTSRASAPLKQAEDAVLVDSTGLTVAQVADAILKLVNERL